MAGPLAGVRIADLTWAVVGCTATKFLAALGAECIRCEWFDESALARGSGASMRIGTHQVPVSEAQGETDTTVAQSSLNRNGFFNDINAGKRSITLNLRTASGRETFKRLVRVSDVVMENFSANVMDKLGLGYEALRTANPDIIYVQSSGWGHTGPNRDLRSLGPSAQAASGLTWQSGFAEREPAGWGFSYMDHHGGTMMALATCMALLRKKRTGAGGYVDMAQTTSAAMFAGTDVPNFVANNRPSVRTGNRSPYRAAAPHGIFPTKGVDNWIAIACFTERDWEQLVACMGNPTWSTDAGFSTLSARLEHLDELDQQLSEWTRTHERYALMQLLQDHGIPSGVCQTAQDRIEHDPQLRSTNYLVPLEHPELGVRLVQNIPFTMSRTDPGAGQPTGRAGPCYGEDNDYVFKKLLQMNDSELADLQRDGAI